MNFLSNTLFLIGLLLIIIVIYFQSIILKNLHGMIKNIMKILDIQEKQIRGLQQIIYGEKAKPKKVTH